MQAVRHAQPHDWPARSLQLSDEPSRNALGALHYINVVALPHTSGRTLKMDDISFNDFKLEKILGQGAFGEVHRAIWKQDGKTYAVKKIIHKYKGRKDRCV